mgnify:FL=1
MVKGLQQFQRRWGSLPQAVREELRREMEKRADDLVAGMKSAAPKDFGALTSSIGWTWGDPPAGSMAVTTVGGDADMRITIYAGNERTIVTNKSGGRFQNARLQEHGTRQMPANPFFWPVYRALKRRTRSGMTRVIKRGIAKG